MSLSAVVMAAGMGTRMKSDLPKPIHGLLGRPMLAWVIQALDAVDPDNVVVVVGTGQNLVADALQRSFPGQEFHLAVQRAMRGTGDAAAVGLGALDLLDGGSREHDEVLVIPGDTPLLDPASVAGFVATHCDSGAAASLMVATVDDPTGYGRVIMNPQGLVTAIVEEADANDDQREIDTINSSIYCFKRSMLAPALRRIGTDNAQGELYLTDVVAILVTSGHRVGASAVPAQQIQGVNDRHQLALASAVLGRRILEAHMAAGVTILAPESVIIEASVQIAADVTIRGGCHLEGDTIIGSGADIGPHTRLVDVTVGANAVVEASTVRFDSIDPGAVIGPYAHHNGAVSQ